MIVARTRIWRAKQVHEWTLNEWYTDEQLVEYFLEITRHWYEDRENLLFGWKDRVRDELIRCLKTGDEPNSPHQLIYAQTKFEREWVGPGGMFEQDFM